MFGCCSFSQSKIRNADGTLNQELIDVEQEKLLKSYSTPESIQEAINDLKACSCMCHVIGAVCLC